MTGVGVTIGIGGIVGRGVAVGSSVLPSVPAVGSSVPDRRHGWRYPSVLQ